MKYTILFMALLLSCPILSRADNDGRKDSFDVRKYTITLDVSDFKTKQIKGMTDISFLAKTNNLQNFRLDFFRLKVDSILQGAQKLSYTYNDSLLHISLPSTMKSGDSAHVQVYYHGKPAVDKGHFGGLDFSDVDSGYAYVLGVTFNFLPHTFGRGWFPCVDNFTDKALFEYYITTKSNHKAFCNGLLMDSTHNINGTWMWHWKMNQPIVPYLAAISAANYVTLYRTYHGTQHDINLICAVPLYDTGLFRKSFAYFNAGMAGFEKDYGLYRFDRAGYFGMPFNGGAMESATNIGLPNIVYSLASARHTWAHELSHHWWGDLMTCSSAEDMWLNEGWANYSESIFEENTLGHNAYIKYARANHFQVLSTAHIADKGFRALSPMPQKYTYSPTIYEKGGDAAHTLRGYLGDSLFFISIRSFLDSFAFRSASSDDFRRVLGNTSGKQNLIDNYFRNWVYSPGLPHFGFDTVSIHDKGNNVFDVDITIRQKQWHSPSLYSTVPLEISWFDSNWKRNDVPVIADAQFTKSGMKGINGKPAFIALNIDNKIEDATTKEYKIVRPKVVYDFVEPMLQLSSSSTADSALVYVEHHWVGPERGALPSSVRISTERYWTIDGIWPAGFDASATINYDGSAVANGGLDSILLSGLPEDSVRLLYRPAPSAEWKEYSDYKRNIANKHDSAGTITINHIKKGDYTFSSSYLPRVGIDEKKPLAGEGIKIYPNPANDIIRIKFVENIPSLHKIVLYDLKGMEVQVLSVVNGQMDYSFDTSRLAPGTYIVKVYTGVGVYEKKVVVAR